MERKQKVGGPHSYNYHYHYHYHHYHNHYHHYYFSNIFYSILCTASWWSVSNWTEWGWDESWTLCLWKMVEGSHVNLSGYQEGRHECRAGKNWWQLPMIYDLLSMISIYDCYCDLWYSDIHTWSIEESGCRSLSDWDSYLVFTTFYLAILSVLPNTKWPTHLLSKKHFCTK